MTKKLMTGFVIVSILVLVFVAFWASFRTVRTRALNIDAADASIESFERVVLSTFLASGSFGSPGVSETVRKWLAAAPNIRAFSIDDGLTPEFVFARSASDVVFSTTPEASTPTPPKFKVRDISDRLFLKKMVLPDNTVYRLTVLATVLSRNDIFPILKEVLITLIAFLLFTAVCIAVYPSLSSKETPDEDLAYAGMPTDMSDAPDPSTLTTSEFRAPDHPDDPVSPVSSDASQARVSPPAPVPPTSGSKTDGPETVLEAQPARPASTRSSAKRGLYSPESNLGWEEYLEERLTTELRRAASFDQDLVLMLLSMPGVYRNSDEFRMFANHVREYFTFRDLCFEYGASGVGVIVPNIDLDQGIEKFEDFYDKGLSGQIRSKLCGGLSARNGRLLQGDRLIREADRAMKKAIEENVHVIAFRVDPEKYRSYIASRT